GGNGSESRIVSARKAWFVADVKGMGVASAFEISPTLRASSKWRGNASCAQNDQFVRRNALGGSFPDWANSTPAASRPGHNFHGQHSRNNRRPARRGCGRGQGDDY